MYSVVLAAVLAGGMDAPECRFLRGRSHCCNCACNCGCNCFCNCFCNGNFQCGYGCVSICFCNCMCNGCYCGGYGYGGYGYGGYGYGGYGNGNGYQVPQAPPVGPQGTGYAVPPSARSIDPEMVRRTSPSSDVARVVLRAPADARLYVNNVSVSGPGTFTTPKLEPAREYAYTVRMELVRNGQTVTEARRIQFTAGRQVEVNFNSSAFVTTRP